MELIRDRIGRSLGHAVTLRCSVSTGAALRYDKQEASDLPRCRIGASVAAGMGALGR